MSAPPRRKLTGAAAGTAWSRTHWATRQCVFAAPYFAIAPPADVVGDRPLTLGASTIGGNRSHLTQTVRVGPNNTGPYWTATDDARLQCDGMWTIAVHVRANFSTGAAGSPQALLAKGGIDDTAGQNHNYILMYDNGTFTDDQAGEGWCVLFERADSVGANVSAKYTGGITAGTEYVFMACLDAQAQQLRLYLDGVLRRTRSTAFVAETNARNFTLGRFSEASDFARFDGWLGGAWVWKNRAFTDVEAMQFAQDPWAMFGRADLGRAAVAAAGGSGARAFVAGMIG